MQRLRGLTPALPPAGVVALVCLVYAGSLANGFVFDDSAYLSSPAIRNFDLPQLVLANWRDLDLYRPLALVSIAVDRALWEERAAGFHLTNVALHGAVTWIVWWLALRLCGSRQTALVAALAFGLHPLQSEVVNWVSARSDLLSTGLVLLGLGAHLRAGSEDGSHRLRWRLLAISCCALAPMAKETGAVFPVVAWWLDRCRRSAVGRSTPLRDGVAWLRQHPGYPLALVAVLALRTAVVIGGGEPPASANFLSSSGLAARWATAVAVLGRYAFLMAYPLRLSADYSYDSIPVSGVGDPWLYAGAVVVLVLVVAARRADGVTAFCAGAFLLAWFPVSNVFFLAPSAMAERYLYPGFYAVAIAFGAGASRLLAGSRTRCLLGTAGLALLLVLWVVRVEARTRDWRDDGTLFTAVAGRFPRNARALENLAHWRARQGDLAAAVDLYRESLVRRPENVRAYINLGVLEGRRGRLRQAAVAFAGALELNPRHQKALLGRAGVLERLGRWRRAAGHYRTVLALSPGHSEAVAGLARVESSGWADTTGNPP